LGRLNLPFINADLIAQALNPADPGSIAHQHE